MERIKAISSTRRSFIAAASFLTLFAIGHSVLGLNLWAQRWWADTFWTAASLGATLLCFRTAKHQPAGRRKRGWFCFGLGSAAWAAGMLAWDYLELIRYQIAPFPSIPDIGYVAFAPLVIAGLYLYTTDTSPAWIDVKQICNLGIILCSMEISTALVLFEPIRSANAPALYVTMAVAYPILYLSAFFFGLVCLWIYVRGQDRPALLLIVAGIGALSIAYIPYAYSLLQRTYDAGSYLDMFWLVGFVCICLAAVQQDRPQSPRAQARLHAPQERNRDFEKWLPACSMLLVVVAAYLFRSGLGPDVWHLLLAPVLLLIGLIGLREWWSYRVEAHLHSHLRRSADEIYRLNRFLESLIENANVWINTLDQAGAIVLWNKAAEAISGYTRDEVAGHTGVWERLYPDDAYRAQIMHMVSAIIEQDKVLEQFETTIVCKNGAARQIAWNARNLLDEQGQPIGAITFGLDVTERKQSEQQRLALERKLQETQKLESLGVLAGGIAHDFNNLLVGVLGNADLALLDLPPDSPIRETIGQIEIAAHRAADLTRQMLAYAGKGRLVVQQLDLNAVVEEMASLLGASIPKHVTLRYALAPQLPQVEADATQLRQVIMNLVVNAAEAIEAPSGTITITTGVQWASRPYLAQTYLAPELPEGQYDYVEVLDTGHGMDAATQAKIFDPFFTTKFTGRGLGLAAVLGIVRGHKGALDISSAPGCGSRFRFLLPTSAMRATTPGAVHEPAELQKGAGMVLVVDDETAVRAIAARMLGRLGFTVLSAEDGRSGIDAFQAHANEIVCVLLDMTMPDLNGDEALRVIRQIKLDARVILMSGYNEQEAVGQLASTRPSAFLAKPFTLAELQTKLHTALAEAAQPG